MDGKKMNYETGEEPSETMKLSESKDEKMTETEDPPEDDCYDSLVDMEGKKENYETREEPLESMKLSESKNEKMTETEESLEDDRYASLGFKSKLLLTIICFGLYSALALEFAIMGPSLVDLQIRMYTTTETISYMFTLRGCMSLLTSIVIGPIFDRFDGYFLMSIGGFISALFLSISPWYRNFATFMCLLTPTGVQGVVSSIGSNIAVIEIWKDRSPSVLQALNCIFSMTLAVGPLIVSMFLIDENADLHENGSHEEHYNFSKNSAKGYQGLATSPSDDQQMILHSTSQSLESASVVETYVQYVFLLAGMYNLFWSVCMLGAFLVYFGKVRKPKVSAVGANNQPVDRKLFICTCILFFFYMFFYGGIEVCYPGYLLTFTVEYLGWSKNMAVYVTLAYQIGNIVATFSCIFLIKFVHPSKIVLMDCSICIISMIVLSFTAYISDTMVWVCSIGLGLGYSTLIPSSYAWVSSNMTIGGTFSAVYWFGFYVSQACIPPLIGYLFEEVEPMSFIYIMTFCGIGILSIFFLYSLLLHFSQTNVIISVDIGMVRRMSAKRDIRAAVQT